MISTKKHVQQLAALMVAKGITDVVISPGSRNGPLIHTFALSGQFNCRSIVDERSAAYFALGLSQTLKRPVAVVCSSGTAALNFSPAVAEAYYLDIPLVVLTADRPGYWINQGENQTISQGNIYRDFCKKEITLPMAETEKELWFAGRIINETLNEALAEDCGPVHINIPLEEPLHELTGDPLPEVKLIELINGGASLSVREAEKLAVVLNQSEKVMILAGQMSYNPGTETILAQFAEKTDAAVLTEHLSNLNNSGFPGCVDILVTSLLSDKITDFQPDLLITMGGSFVSKPLKQFLRTNRPLKHWHLSLSGRYYDTYGALTEIIKMKPASFFLQIADKVIPKENGFMLRWQKKEEQVRQLRDGYLQKAGFCDLRVFSTIMNAVPANSVVHLGNSSPVRYALICNKAKDVVYVGNRGTSGIDGSLSTSAGYASVSEKLNTIILGDLSFFYDSNALWNKYIGKNLRIIVIHNGGGNIFSMIKGPGESPAFNEFFFTENKNSAAGIAQTFGLDYLKASEEPELSAALQQLYDSRRNNAVILEIFTDAALNSKMFRGLFKMVKNA